MQRKQGNNKSDDLQIEETQDVRPSSFPVLVLM